jgi:hypothetical protein
MACQWWKTAPMMGASDAMATARPVQLRDVAEWKGDSTTAVRQRQMTNE